MHRNRTWLIGSSAEERIRNRTLPVEGGDGSTLSLDFTTGVLDPRLTFTRGTNATFINSSGLVQYADANYVLNNNDVTASGWSIQNGVGRSFDNSVVNPEGSLGASLVTASSSLGSSAVTTSTFTINGGLAYTVSFWVRAGTATQLLVGVYDISSFTPATAAVISGPGSAAGSSSIVVSGLTSSWTRVRLYLSTVNSGSRGVSFYPDAALASGKSVYIWGVKWEAGHVANPTQITTGATAYYAPRFDYDPTSIGTPRGLLIEGSATNICTYSGDMTQSGAGHWTARTNLDTSAWTGFTAPDGTSTAVKLIPNTTNGLHNIQSVSGSLTLVAYTASAFVKADGRTVVGLAIGGSQAWQNFVLTGNGSLGSASTSPAPNSTITPVGSTGWYRVTMTWTSTLSASGVQLFVTLPQTSSTSPFSSYAGDGTQNGVQAWGYQLELGSGASSYIPTGASTGNRAADSCYMDGTNFSSWYNASTQTGTLFADITHSAASVPNNGIELGAGLGSQVTSNRVSLRRDAVIVDGVAALTVSPTGASQRFKTAIAFAPGTGNTAACRNGGTVSNPAQAAGTLSGINALKLYVDSTLYPNGWIRQVKVWPTNLPNATLQSITTI